MAAKTKTTVYDKVVKITQDYFGPAANRFIHRQVSNHLGKNPEQLRQQDLKKLIDWMGIVMALLVEDEAIVKSYTADLKKLATN